MNEDQNEEVRQDVGIDQRFEDTKTPAHDDKRGDRTMFYVAHVDGVPNGYAENNRTKEVVRWKARGTAPKSGVESATSDCLNSSSVPGSGRRC